MRVYQIPAYFCLQCKRPMASEYADPDKSIELRFTCTNCDGTFTERPWVQDKGGEDRT